MVINFITVTIILVAVRHDIQMSNFGKMTFGLERQKKELQNIVQILTNLSLDVKPKNGMNRLK